jgi:osmoprotectant transport system ATP-binding protein
MAPVGHAAIDSAVRSVGTIAPDPVPADAPAISNGSPHALPVAFRQATKIYPGAAEPAVRALELEVPAGEICVFVGPSGSGKTTAMRMVNRMVEITEGDILVGGTSVRERSPA